MRDVAAHKRQSVGVVTDIVRQGIEDVLRARGYSKRSGSWYRTQRETVAVIDLQRSNYSPAYYLNVALWLLALGREAYPKEHHCHVRTRIDELVDDAEMVASALDPASTIDPDRRTGILTHAVMLADDLLAACATLEGCRSDQGRRLIDRCLIRANAVPLVKG